MICPRDFQVSNKDGSVNTAKVLLKIEKGSRQHPSRLHTALSPSGEVNNLLCMNTYIHAYIHTYTLQEAENFPKTIIDFELSLFLTPQ